jgi:hypothetical protein
MSASQIQRRQTTTKKANVKVALRVPEEVHNLIRLRAARERLSVNQAIVRAMEMFSGTPNSEIHQEIRDLVEVCRLLGPEVNSDVRHALAERVKSVYGMNLPLLLNASDFETTKGGNNALELKG